MNLVKVEFWKSLLVFLYGLFFIICMYFWRSLWSSSDILFYSARFLFSYLFMILGDFVTSWRNKDRFSFTQLRHNGLFIPSKEKNSPQTQWVERLTLSLSPLCDQHQSTWAFLGIISVIYGRKSANSQKITRKFSVNQLENTGLVSGRINLTNQTTALQHFSRTRGVLLWWCSASVVPTN